MIQSHAELIQRLWSACDACHCAGEGTRHNPFHRQGPACSGLAAAKRRTPAPLPPSGAKPVRVRLANSGDEANACLAPRRWDAQPSCDGLLDRRKERSDRGWRCSKAKEERLKPLRRARSVASNAWMRRSKPTSQTSCACRHGLGRRASMSGRGKLRVESVASERGAENCRTGRAFYALTDGMRPSCRSRSSESGVRLDTDSRCRP